MKKVATTEEKILRVGRQLFSKGGYAGTSMSDIATKVGVTKASLYHFFKNKQTLYLSILSDLLDQIDDIYSVDPSSNPAKHLQAAVLETIKISEGYGSMLENVDPAQLDVTTSEFKEMMVRKAGVDKTIQGFLQKCGVKDTLLASHTLGSATHGYIQRVLYGINDIKAEPFARYITKLLTK